jgi:Ca2+-binding RTX toxin-like protein
MAIIHGYKSADLLIGTNGSDTIYGKDGADHLYGLGGNDHLHGGTGADYLDGGPGSDTAVYDTSTVGVSVNLFTGRGYGGLAEGDTLHNVENVVGSDHPDILFGDNGTNYLIGNLGSDVLWGRDGGDLLMGDSQSYNMQWGGDDTLKGGGGDDTLIGMVGDDYINGGSGRDSLFGDFWAFDGVAGADTFAWWETSDTGTTRATADTIYDFDFAEGDRIDLQHIDANVYAAGDQAFTFVGIDSFSGAPGEIRYYTTYYEGELHTFIELQTGNSSDVEAVIRLYGYHEVEASWFVL